MIELREPCIELLPQYAAALRNGWSPNTVRDVSGEQLALIEAGAEAFLTELVRQDGTIKLPDREVPRLPSKVRWIWDGEFCGAINLRWQPGTESLPEHTLGHIGYATVPWKSGRGYATAALALMLPEARAVGLKWLEITTDKSNEASQSIITRNGGRLIEEFVYPSYGPQVRLRYRIDLA